MRSRREFAIASVRAHDALVLRSGLFLPGGRHNVLPVPSTVPPRSGAVSLVCLGKSECARLRRRRRARLGPRDTTARHTARCARRFAPSTSLRAVRAALRAACVHCSPKPLKMGYALIMGHTPAEATGCDQAAGMRRTLLNTLV